jgi:hypothetical protein
LNLSFYCFIFNSWDGFCDWYVFSLLFVHCSRNILSLVFNWIVICHIFSFWHLNLNCLCFHLNNLSLILSVFHSWFSLDCGLWSSLDSHWLLNNLLNCHRLDNRLCHGSSIRNWGSVLNRLSVLNWCSIGYWGLSILNWGSIWDWTGNRCC